MFHQIKGLSALHRQKKQKTLETQPKGKKNLKKSSAYPFQIPKIDSNETNEIKGFQTPHFKLR